MALAVGPITASNKTSNGVTLTTVAGSGGTGPYNYKWYKSFTTGFTPGTAYLIPGLSLTSLSVTDTQLLPAIPVYYVVQVVDLGNGSATALSSQLTVTPLAGNPVEMNQLVQTPVIGQLDQPTQPNTVSVIMDSSVGASVYPPGTAVKQVAPTGVTAGQGLNTLPHVVPCSANSDTVLGFIQFSMKDVTFGAGSPMEISKTSNVQWQVATANGVAGDPMQLDISVAGGAQTVVGESGATKIGQAIDQPVIGMPFRLAISVLPDLKA